jgi:hypothetical protein
LVASTALCETLSLTVACLCFLSVFAKCSPHALQRLQRGRERERVCVYEKPRDKERGRE